MFAPLTAVILTAAAPAMAADAPLRSCTDRGGLIGVEHDDGSVEGVLHRWKVRGTREALQLVDDEGHVVWTGPLDALEPGPAPRPTPDDVAARFEALVPGLVARGADVKGLGFHGEVGPDGLLRGVWRDGAVAVYALDLREDGIFGGHAAMDTPLDDLPGALSAAPSSDPLTGGRPAARAAALGKVVSARLEAAGMLLACAPGGPDRLWVGAWPEPLPLPAGAVVTWAGEDATLVRGPDGARLYRVVRDEQGGVSLQLEPIALGELPSPGPTTTEPFHAAGREIVAAVNQARVAAGLPPVAWDDALAWNAAAGCAAGHATGDAPWEAVGRWLSDPSRAAALLDPTAKRAGACSTPAGAHVIALEP
jgi:hypothetical protein